MSTMKVNSIKRVDGTDWVAQYFDTVQDMKNNAEIIEEGMTVAVRGLETKSDGKQSFYIVRFQQDEAPADDMYIIELNEYLVAKLTIGYYKTLDDIGSLEDDITAVEDELVNKVDKDSDTGAAMLPSGISDERPSPSQNGYMRYNTELKSYEGFSEGAWGSIGGGATGGTLNSVFYENDAEVTVDYTITAGKNAMSAGPIEILDAVEVTIPDNSTWSIV